MIDLPPQPPCERPGYCYMQPDAALRQAMVKSLASGGLYVTLKVATMKTLPAALVSTLGLFAVSKGVELAKGHHLPWGDTIGDAAWHSLIVLPLALNPGKHPLRAILSVGATTTTILLTRPFASPRW